MSSNPAERTNAVDPEQVPPETAQSIRTRAAIARRLSAEIADPNCAAELREIADRLDAEANALEKDELKKR